MSPTTSQQIRQQLKAKRNALSEEQQALASAKVCERLMKHPWFMQSTHIALYYPFQGEISLLSLLSQTKKFYLPIVQKDNRILKFALFDGQQELNKNAMGTLEPITDSFCDAFALDLICVPLVAFDAHGHRLGMGLGYYDATFHQKIEHQQMKPWLMGIAYDWQQVSAIQTKPYDVDLDAVITETTIFIPC